MSEKKKGIEVRELAEKFFEEEINKLDDPQRKEEVELEKETYIGVWMLGYRAGESTAEQPVADSELKQEVDHLEKKISLCEDALEKLHAERYETRLSLRMLLKVFKNDQISKDQKKYYSQAETILEKHGKVTDVLRTGAVEQPGREVEAIAFAEWLYKNRWFHFENGKWHYTFEMGTVMGDKSYQKNYVKTTAQLWEVFKKEKV